MDAGNEAELTLHIEYDHSKRYGASATKRKFSRSLPTKYKIAFYWEIRILQSNAKSVFGFHLREIRPQGRFQLKNPNRDFMDFLLTVRLGNPSKDLQNCSRQERSFFADYACACKTAVLKDSQFQIPFRISQSNGKKEI